MKSVTEPLVNKDGSAAVFTLVSSSAPSSRATETLVNHLRDDVIPKDTKGNGMRADVGGTTAGYIDLAKQITRKLPLVIGIVLALSFVLLLLAFRSVAVPIKAVILNLLSIGAAFGIVTFAFGHDWSAQLVGLDGTVPIVSFVPLMMFAILFGLSMDYEVFLMTHVRERWQATGDPHQAVIDGLAGTARVITSAALIMVSVFCAFLINGDPNIKQFGLGMAAAVAVDATVVRCLLVPAIMSLLGRAGWWLPGWLERHLPHLSIEGEEYFAEREAAAAGGRRSRPQAGQRLAQPGEPGERGVDHGVGVRLAQRPAALQPAVEERAPDEVDGEREVEVVRQLARRLRAAQPLQADARERAVDPLAPRVVERGVVEDLRRERAHRRVVAGVLELGDGRAQDDLEVGGEVAGVRQRLDAVVALAGDEQRVEQHGALRRPPAVDRLLAHAGSRGDPFHARLRVADLLDEIERGIEDRAAGALAAAGGVRHADEVRRDGPS